LSAVCVESMMSECVNDDVVVMATDVDSVTNSQLTYSVSDGNFSVQTVNNIAYIRTAQSVTAVSSASLVTTH